MATLLTPKEVAKQLGMTVQELHKLRRRHQGPAWCRINQKTIRYVSDDVVKWMQEQQQHQNAYTVEN